MDYQDMNRILTQLRNQDPHLFKKWINQNIETINYEIKTKNDLSLDEFIKKARKAGVC